MKNIIRKINGLFIAFIQYVRPKFFFPAVWIDKSTGLESYRKQDSGIEL